MVRKTFSSILIILSFSHLLLAKTWIVAKDGSGDFTEIQEAIDAAVDGDVIIVRPGIYEPIVIKTKTLAIVGSGPDSTKVEFLGIGTIERGAYVAYLDGDQVLIAHLSLRAPYPCLTIASNGKVVLSDVELRRDYTTWFSTGYGLFHGGGPALFCRCYVKDLIPPDIDVPGGSPEGAYLGDSLSVLSQGYFNGHEGKAGTDGSEALPGGAGILAESSEVYLAEVSTKGGLGGSAWVGGVYCDEMRPAERGGHGLELITGATVVAAARAATATLEGGKGGYGGPLWYHCGSPAFEGGPGGDGVNVDSRSLATLSGSILPLGGPGGDGDPIGPPGQDKRGTVIVEDEPYPTLTIEGTGAIGSPITLQVHADPGDRVVLFVSDNFSKTALDGIGGFPLFASPLTSVGGTFFRVFPAGAVIMPPLTIRFTVPDDQDLIGKLALFQVLVVPQDTDLQPKLTNVVAEIVRDK
jgi:hypothetical protein